MDGFIKKAGWPLYLIALYFQTYAETVCPCALLLCLPPTIWANTTSEKLNHKSECKRRGVSAGLERFLRGRKQGIAPDRGQRNRTVVFFNQTPSDPSHLPHFLASHRSPPSRNAVGLTFFFSSESQIWEKGLMCVLVIFFSKQFQQDLNLESLLCSWLVFLCLFFSHHTQTHNHTLFYSQSWLLCLQSQNPQRKNWPKKRGKTTCFLRKVVGFCSWSSSHWGWHAATALAKRVKDPLHSKMCFLILPLKMADLDCIVLCLCNVCH